MGALEEWNAVREEAWDLAPRLARKVDAAITELTNERNLSRELCQEALRQGAKLEAKLQRLVNAEMICGGSS